MAPETTPPLTQFLRFLSTHPAPETVASALIRGPLQFLNPRALMVWSNRASDTLSAISHDRIPRRAAQMWQELPLEVDVPAVRAYRASEVLVHDLATLAEAFPVLALDRPSWAALHRPDDDGILVSAPIVSRGASVGAFSFGSPRRSSLSTLEVATLDGVSAALGLWLFAIEADQRRDHDRPLGEVMPIALTHRQVEVALLVEQGQTNAEIGALLGYSAATIKAEVQQLMRRMRANTRLEAARRARDLGLLPPSA